MIANEFSEATGDLYLSALIEIGLALFLVTIVVNAVARLLVWAVTRGAPARVALTMSTQPLTPPGPWTAQSKPSVLNSMRRQAMNHLVTTLSSF